MTGPTITRQLLRLVSYPADGSELLFLSLQVFHAIILFPQACAGVIPTSA